MKSFSFFVALVIMLPAFLTAQNTYVPDDNFEQALIDKGYDTGPLDDYVLTANISGILHLDVGSHNIADLTGIQDFVALTSLNCDYNQLTGLDVSANTALISLVCGNNQLTALDVSANTALEALDCGGGANEITSLDVSSNTKLRSLDCSSNQLTVLDVSANPALEFLNCDLNQLTVLDVSFNIKLRSLICSFNQLTILDVSANPDLEYLDCWYNELTVLDVGGSIRLMHLYCSGNQLTALDVSSNTKLRSLDCGNNQLTTLDVSANPDLGSLECDSNQLTILDVSANTTLQSLNCRKNELTVLDVSANILLWSLDCSFNELTSLNIQNGNNSNLGFFDATNNLNLICIKVDDINFAEEHPGWDKDPTASFSMDCRISNPIISPNGGQFLDTVEVVLSTETEDGRIYYTLDGSDPDTNSLLYTEPIALTETTLLKAKAFKEGYVSSEVSSMFFEIVSLEEPTIISSGGDDLDISFQTDSTWVASTTDVWISIGVSSGSSGTHLLELEIVPSDLAVSRSGTVIIRSDEGDVLFSLTITQSAAEGDYAVPLAMSARTAVGSGANIVIPGMVFKGPNKTKLVVRGVGPSLADLGVSGVLNDPEIVIYSGATPIASNNDWQQAPEDLAAYFKEVGLLALEDGTKDAAAYLELDPGAYTMHLRGVNGGEGIGLAEVYVVDPAISGSGLVGLSTRAEVGEGDRVLIPGFVIAGNQSRRVLVRGVGPGLAGSNVPGFLPDPQIAVYEKQTLIDFNEDWEDEEPEILSAAFAEVGLLAFAEGSKDAAILLTLPPGVYTAHIRSSDGTLGVGLLEMYFLD